MQSSAIECGQVSRRAELEVNQEGAATQRILVAWAPTFDWGVVAAS
jgi:hypothetical protein